MQLIVSILVHNKVGVLSQVADVFFNNKLNISSISAGETENHSITRIIITTRDGLSVFYDKVIKEIEQLADVIEVSDQSSRRRIVRELALIKVKILPTLRAKLSGIIDGYKTTIFDITKDCVIIEIVESEQRINSLLERLENYKLLEVARSGQIAVAI